MDELEFQGLLIDWTAKIAADEPNLPFRRLRQEMPSRKGGKRDDKRRDLVLVDQSEKPLVSGELRLPDHPEGKTPDIYPFVENAYLKANQLGLRYYFTWNINGAIIWDAQEPAGLGFIDRQIAQFNLADEVDVQVDMRRELDDSVVQQGLFTWWRRFLRALADRLAGRLAAAPLPLDQQFVGVLEFALQPVVRTVHLGLSRRFTADPKFARQLTNWMRHDQQWVVDPPERIQTEGMRAAAKLACYTMMLKLVFYEALRRQEDLAALNVSNNVKSAPDLRRYLDAAFKSVQAKTKDYELLFTFDFADDLALIDDLAVPEWRTLVDDIGRFDLARLPYEVVGLIFQRLISPEERHKYGQYYTPSTIVDLINAFCITRGDSRYYDPASGGGTFPVRAYVRKRYLDPKLSHQAALASTWASDISKFAAQLTIVNLATRELVEAENYPMVSQRDFFDAVPGKPFATMPVELSALPSNGRDHGKFVYTLPTFDAIASNLPYVRQELVDKQTIERVLAIDFHGKQPRHSKRSDLHVYFWFHAWTMLADHGYFGFLTSSAWLETSYGFNLQEFLLDHFAIKVIAESEVEPWFSDARVGTVCTIAQREDDEAARDSNVVRFVRFRKPLSELLPTTRDEAVRQRAVDSLANAIREVDADADEPRWRMRVVQQGSLRQAGEMTVRPEAYEEGDADESDEEDESEE